MTNVGLIFAQAAPPAPSLAPLVQRVVQGELWAPPGSIHGLWLVLLAWFAVLAIVAACIQRDWPRWLRGLVDIRAHLEQIGAGLDILRRNKRPLWILLTAGVVSWTSWSLGWWFIWKHSSADAEMERTEWEAMLAIRNNSAVAFAGAHALTAGLVPLRALTSLADLTPLLIGACLVLFARSDVVAQHLRGQLRPAEHVGLRRRMGTVWVGLVVLVGYRVVTFLTNPAAAPIGGCLWIDSLILPALVLVGDALLLSWVLTEFGRSLRRHLDWRPDDTAALVRMVPSVMWVCASVNPGRYLTLGLVIWEFQLSSPAAPTFPASRWSPILWCSALAQVCGLAWFALPGVLTVWRTGGLGHKFHGLIRLFRQAGGKVVGLAGLGLVMNVLALVPFYFLFGSMQAEPWSLLGAASYGYYAQLLVSLVLMVGVTELARQELGLEDEPRYSPLVPELLEAVGVERRA
ncbi:MAG: hypothetical protein HY000_25180 [Planctomycetes bacterium]|nr:hypothetical protein [Planctomycetota bacterium]